jgi:hypothetical protein
MLLPKLASALKNAYSPSWYPTHTIASDQGIYIMVTEVWQWVHAHGIH